MTLNFTTFKLYDYLIFVEIENIFYFKPRRKNWVRLCWNCFRTNEYNNAFETGLIHGNIVAHAWKLSQNAGLTFITCSLRTCHAIIGVQQHNKLKYVSWESLDGKRSKGRSRVWNRFAYLTPKSDSNNLTLFCSFWFCRRSCIIKSFSRFSRRAIYRFRP